MSQALSISSALSIPANFPKPSFPSSSPPASLRKFPAVYVPDEGNESTASPSFQTEPRLAVSEPAFDLAELVDQEVRAYQAWGNDAGRLFARHMAELAERIRFTGATTAADFEARSELFEQWSSEG